MILKSGQAMEVPEILELTQHAGHHLLLGRSFRLALCDGCKRGMAIINILEQLGVDVSQYLSLPMLVDNEAAITLANTSVFSKGIRHTRIRFAYVSVSSRSKG